MASRTILRRGMAAAAAAELAPSSSASATFDGVAHATVLASSGVTVTSIDAPRATTSLSVRVGAGSKFETTPTLGASHVLRAMAFQDTTEKSGFRITREAEKHGVSFTAVSTREAIAYNATTIRGADATPFAAEVLGLTVSTPEFNHWTIADQTAKIQADATAGASDAAFLSIDMLHKLAFKGGLSNSLVCPQSKIGGVSPADLESFHKNHFVGGNISVLGYGIDHGELCELAERSFSGVVAGSVENPVSEFKGAGRELHHETGGANTYLTFGFEGVAAGSSEAVAVDVLKSLLASPASTRGMRYEGNSHSLIGAGVTGSAEGFSVGYSETGLFGVFVSTPVEDSSTAYEAVCAGIAAAKSGSFSDADVAKARNNAMIAKLDDSAEGVFSNLSSGATFESISASYDAVSTADVKAAASKFLAADPCVVITGATTSL